MKEFGLDSKAPKKTAPFQIFSITLIAALSNPCAISLAGNAYFVAERTQRCSAMTGAFFEKLPSFQTVPFRPPLPLCVTLYESIHIF